MKFKYRFGIWLAEHFDIPKYHAGEQVVVLPQRALGEIKHVGRNGRGWGYQVKFEKPMEIGGFMRTEWYEIGQSLALPYIVDILKSLPEKDRREKGE